MPKLITKMDEEELVGRTENNLLRLSMALAAASGSPDKGVRLHGAIMNDVEELLIRFQTAALELAKLHEIEERRKEKKGDCIGFHNNGADEDDEDEDEQ